MPHRGSQIILCDLPIRLDTYVGCSHACEYCFAARKTDINKIRRGETVKALAAWIAGQRTAETRWCDWPIPLHWGGLSDPFQPCEASDGNSLACLGLFADSGYPVVISTKGRLVTEPPYLDRLRRCNAVVQVSLVGPTLAAFEPGAPTVAERLRMLTALSEAVKRTIVRVQPYAPAYRQDVLAMLPRYREAGVYGVTVEALKCFGKPFGPDMVRLSSEWVYPAEQLRRDFLVIREACAAHGLRFYAAENRLRGLGCNACCCGVDGLDGFEPNTANLNHLGPGETITYRPAMFQPGQGRPMAASHQSTAIRAVFEKLSYRDVMEAAKRTRSYRVMMGLPVAES